MNEIEKLTSGTDFITNERYEEIIKPLKELAVNRSFKYGNSIYIMDDTSILDLCLMKLVRTKNMFKHNDDSTKYYDEIGDCINYLVYILRRKLDNDKQLPDMTNEKFNSIDKKGTVI